ncbi:MAG: hypothetical protein ABSB76_35680, partial [Streptosporangiaceae bacterium]
MPPPVRTCPARGETGDETQAAPRRCPAGASLARPAPASPGPPSGALVRNRPGVWVWHRAPKKVHGATPIPIRPGTQ